jgi:hypothetical protein
MGSGHGLVMIPRSVAVASHIEAGCGIMGLGFVILFDHPLTDEEQGILRDALSVIEGAECVDVRSIEQIESCRMREKHMGSWAPNNTVWVQMSDIYSVPGMLRLIKSIVQPTRPYTAHAIGYAPETPGAFDPYIDMTLLDDTTAEEQDNLRAALLALEFVTDVEVTAGTFTVRLRPDAALQVYVTEGMADVGIYTQLAPVV